MKIDNMREEHRERLKSHTGRRKQTRKKPRKRLWICGSIDRPRE